MIYENQDEPNILVWTLMLYNVGQIRKVRVCRLT